MAYAIRQKSWQDELWNVSLLPTVRTAAAARGVPGRVVDLRCFARVRPVGRFVLDSAVWLTARRSDVRRAVTGMVVSRRL